MMVCVECFVKLLDKCKFSVVDAFLWLFACARTLPHKIVNSCHEQKKTRSKCVRLFSELPQVIRIVIKHLCTQ